jgi:hypothetical protein
MTDFQPDIVLNELTDLPDDAADIGAHTDRNARIRTEGTQNLIDAARHSGSPKLLAQSVAWQLRKVPTPWLSASWSGWFLTKVVWCCATGSSTAQAPITNSDSLTGLRSRSTTRSNAPSEPCRSRRASSTSPTEQRAQDGPK